MRVNHRLSRIILTLLCAVFFSGVSLAQNPTDLPAGRDPVTNLSVEREKAEIYSKLKCCPCKESFAQCTCAEAKEMKAYIDALMDAGISKDDIFYKIAKKYSLKVIIDEKLKSSLEQRLIKEAGDKRPQLLLETAVFDFGTVSQKLGILRKVFKIENKGNSDLIINNLRTSCGCVSVALDVGENKSPYFSNQGSGILSQLAIAPGKSAGLEIVFDLHHASIKPGKVIREILFSSNDPVNKDLAIMLQMTVKE